MDQKVIEWIDAHKQDLLEDIKALCAIPSVKAEPLEGKPYGEESYRALNLAIDMASKYGFTTRNYDNYVGCADFDTALPRTLDILAHTDVVPAGEGWTVTEPFHIIEKDGRLYGRGTSDDKGPMLCALYAMRALKECKVPMKKGVRLIMGSDEETGSSDIEHYYALEPEAEMTFSPDAEFPLINIEKGQFRGIISQKYEESLELPRVLSLDAGVAFNAVPQKAVIHFEGLDMEAAKADMEAVAKECQVEVSVTGEQEITIIGESAHASTPELGKNAGLAAMILVSRLPLANSTCLDLVKKIPQLFPYGVTDGSGIGIKMCDEESHDLTCTLDLYHVDPTGMEFTFDARVPVMGTKENCQDVAQEKIEAAGFAFDTPGMIPPHRVAGDSDFVQTLLGSYERMTGLKGECLAIGGGTYVHELKNGVAFGAILPDVDTHMHGADEFMDIDNIMIAAKVFADAIWELCGDHA